MTAPFILSITSVFTPEQQPRGSAHSKAFAQQIQAGGVYLGFRTLRGRKFPHGNFRTSVFCVRQNTDCRVFRQSRSV